MYEPVPVSKQKIRGDHIQCQIFATAVTKATALKSNVYTTLVCISKGGLDFSALENDTLHSINVLFDVLKK